MKKIKTLFIIFLIIFPIFSFGAETLDVVINEICWMGTEVSSNDEWIELYNNKNSDLNLDGWKLISEGGKLKIELKGKIKANSFFVLERTDDKTLPEILADQIYKGALNNRGEFLKLIDDKGNVIDQIDCSQGWFAGESKTKRTMEKINPKLAGSDKKNWKESENPGGTPKGKNSRGKKEEFQKKLLEITYPEKIFINEILPYPQGPDAKKEYIEIFNPNNFEVDLNNWSLEDVKGKTKNFVLKEKIKPKGFLMFYRKETKITLNNSEDGLKLFKPNGEIADEVYYQKAPKGKSFNRVDEKWIWSSILTPGTKNVLSEKSKKNRKREISKIKEKELLGALPQIFPENQKIPKNFLIVLSIALILALFSGILILLLKRKLKGIDLK